MVNPALHYLPECASTNDEAAKLFTLSPNLPLGVYTFSQTSGRGQYGNVWKSEPGKNLAFSYIRGAEKTSPSLINYYTACLVRDFLASMSGAKVKIKWPNDLIINNKKICGILTERKNIAGRDCLITGIGINVNQEDFGEIAKAGSLKTQTGQFFEPQTVAEALWQKINLHIQQNPKDPEVMDDFNKNLFRKGEVSVFVLNGERQNGIIQHADEAGKLWIHLERDGLLSFYHKEIEMLY